ncbi:MAG: VOC family protein [Chloroflexi bacterium]|nr:MAG: VOC family protein [Chloroflexota bacterium]
MSNILLSPYVNFQGRASEAMEFYHRVLGGNLVLQTMNEQGEVRPAGPGDRIAYARLDAEGARIVGSDGHPKYPAKVGENLAIALNGTDRERITKIFKALAEGGQAKAQLTKQPWGGEAGYLLDRFGINWVVSIDMA